MSWTLEERERGLQLLIREVAAEDKKLLRKNDLQDVEGLLEAHARTYGEKVHVWYRVAPCEGGFELDVGDDVDTRLRVTKSGIQTADTSKVIFQRTSLMQALARPSEEGDLIAPG